jgi:hypothetical protein
VRQAWSKLSIEPDLSVPWAVPASWAEVVVLIGKGVIGARNRQFGPVPGAVEGDHLTAGQALGGTAGQVDRGPRAVGGVPAVHAAGQFEGVVLAALRAQLRGPGQAAASGEAAVGVAAVVHDPAAQMGVEQIAPAVAGLNRAVAVPLAERAELAAHVIGPGSGQDVHAEAHDDQDQNYPEHEVALAGLALGRWLPTPHGCLHRACP